MNKSECKSYIKKSIKNILQNNRTITLKNLEIEMNRVMKDKYKEYIAYAKISLHTLRNSANDILPKDVADELDSICKLYNKVEIIEKAKEITKREEKGDDFK